VSALILIPNTLKRANNDDKIRANTRVRPYIAPTGN